jgi:hypothetical protein
LILAPCSKFGEKIVNQSTTTPPVEPESDPSTWPAWTDNWYWACNTDLPAADRLGQAADTMEHIAEVLDGLAPPELADLVDAIDGPFAREVLSRPHLD